MTECGKKNIYFHVLKILILYNCLYRQNYVVLAMTEKPIDGRCRSLCRKYEPISDCHYDFRNEIQVLLLLS